MAPVIQVEQLSKAFSPRGPLSTVLPWRGREPRRPVRALHEISLRVERGEIYGLLGPNGAGKTTLVRILSTLLLPSSGRAWVLGHDVVADGARVRSHTGLVVGGERSFYWRLTGRQNLEFFGALQGLGRADLRRRLGELDRLLGLGEALDRRFDAVSTGMRQRLALARSLLHRPDLLLMDEPTRSLDPGAARAFHGLLEGLVSAGTTIVLVTHALEEARRLCHRAALLVDGRLEVETRDPAELATRFDGLDVFEGLGGLDGLEDGPAPGAP